MLMLASRRVFVVAALEALLIAPVSEAKVTKITISSTTPAYNGRVFGAVGAYEQLRGTAAGELDPSDPLNAVITDINLAPLTNGKVTYTTTFTLLKPVDMSKASGVLEYEVNNRGNKILPGFLNVGVTAANPAGDGFLFNTGIVYLWSGWQGDLVFNPALPLETIDVPVAKGVTGPTFARFVTRAGQRQDAVSARARPHTGQHRYDEGEADLDRA